VKIGIVEPNLFSKRAISSLGKVGIVTTYSGEKTDINDFISDKNIIFVRLNFLWNKHLLKNAKNLEYLCSPTTGENHIDKEYVKSRGIKLITLKNESHFLATIRATPEHTFGLVLALLRNYKFLLSDNKKSFEEREFFRGNEIYKKRIGLIGYGRVGKILKKYFTAFGANIGFYDIKSTNHINSIKKFESIEELILNSNIIILCASYFASNDKMIDVNLLKLMKNKYFINTARGELVDEDIILDLIQINHFKGLAIDVFSNENGEHDFEKFKTFSANKNIILTPHVSGVTYESMEKTEEFIVDKLIKRMKPTET
jgi:D-3-phosphoglycerate dehydrogenase / 2-oxoglutarate reductase